MHVVGTASGTRTVPWDWYSDPAVLRLERERIFRRTWQYAGRADQVAEPGSYVACDAGGVPVVVVRDQEAILRAFVNVCRHRGSLVCEGEGRRETLQCPYHAWTYNLDASLRDPGRAAAARRRRRPRCRHAPLPPPLALGVRRQLEALLRELPRVLPLPGRA